MASKKNKCITIFWQDTRKFFIIVDFGGNQDDNFYDKYDNMYILSMKYTLVNVPNPLLVYNKPFFNKLFDDLQGVN